MRAFRLLFSIACLVLASKASATDIKPALVYDLGGKFDKSFNEGAFRGGEKFTADTGIPVRDFEIQNDAQREQALRRLVVFVIAGQAQHPSGAGHAFALDLRAHGGDGLSIRTDKNNAVTFAGVDQFQLL